MTTTKDEIAVLLTVLRAVVETGRVERIDIPHIERGISALTRFEAETMERAAKIADRIVKECERDERHCSLDDEFGASVAFGGKIESRKIATAIRNAKDKP